MTDAFSPREISLGLIQIILFRMAFALLTLSLMSAVVFAVSNLLPGDAAQDVLCQSAIPAQIEALRHDMGINRPALSRYAASLLAIVSAEASTSFVANYRFARSSLIAFPTRSFLLELRR